MDTQTPLPPSKLRSPPTPRSKPDRCYVLPGDVLYLHPFTAHLRVTHESFEWLDEPTQRARLSTHEDLETALDIGNAELITAGISSIHEWEHYDTVLSTFKHTDPHEITTGGAPSTQSLSLAGIRGTGSKYCVNGFLKDYDINYDGDPIGNGFKYALAATYNDSIVAIAVLGKPTARLGWDRHSTIQLLKFAAHPGRPVNTGSWLLSRACRWAYLEGYDTFLTYAGAMNSNTGVMYDATGFHCHDIEENHDGDGWLNRDNRNGTGTYTKRTWVKDLAEPHSLECRRRRGRSSQTQGYFSQFIPTDISDASLDDLTLTREDPLAGENDPVSTFSATHARSPIETPESPPVAIFGARYNDTLVATVTVSDPTENPRDNFDTCTITTLATHPELNYPDNILRWLISAAQQWSELHGYTQLATIATPDTEALFKSTHFTNDPTPGLWTTTHRTPQSSDWCSP